MGERVLSVISFLVIILVFSISLKYKIAPGKITPSIIADRSISCLLGEKGTLSDFAGSIIRALAIVDDLVIAVSSRFFNKKRYSSCLMFCWRVISNITRSLVG